MSEAKKSTKSGFTPEERAAMKERAKELKSAANDAEAEKLLLAKIADMSPDDRAMAERVHSIVTENAPSLKPKLYYGMPAYALDGKVVCFFQDAKKFNTRYSTFGLTDVAMVDDGNVWPVAYALATLTDADEKMIASLVKKAVS